MRHARRRRFVPCGLRLESRRLLTTNFQAVWLGQTANMDLTGPDAGVGPDGYVDDEIQLTAANAGLAIQSVQISLIGSTNPRWESAPDLDGYSNAEVIDVSGSSGKTYNVFFNPFGLSGPKLQTGQNQQLAVNVYYSDQNGQQHRQPHCSGWLQRSHKNHHPDRACVDYLEWFHGKLERTGHGSKWREGPRFRFGADPSPSWGPSCPTRLPTTSTLPTGPTAPLPQRAPRAGPCTSTRPVQPRILPLLPSTARPTRP